MSPDKNECYKFALDAALGDYDQAKAYCLTQGGYLTDILDQETQNFLLSNIPSDSGIVWMIGANDIETVSYIFFTLTILQFGGTNQSFA